MEVMKIVENKFILSLSDVYQRMIILVDLLSHWWGEVSDGDGDVKIDLRNDNDGDLHYHPGNVENSDILDHPGDVDYEDGGLLDHPGASELRALEPLLKQIQLCAHWRLSCCEDIDDDVDNGDDDDYDDGDDDDDGSGWSAAD